MTGAAQGGSLKGTLPLWPAAAGQEARAAAHGTGPVVLGLLPAGEGNGLPVPAEATAGGRGPQQDGWASLLLSLEAWAAWRGFVQEARRKKAREEQAVQVYQLQLLREGVERLLRFAAGMKAFRQQLHAQQQVQVGLGCPHPPSPVGMGGTAPP